MTKISHFNIMFTNAPDLFAHRQILFVTHRIYVSGADIPESDAVGSFEELASR